MIRPPAILEKFLLLFESPKIRWAFVGMSFLLHLVSGVLYLKENDLPISTYVAVAAALSLIPIVLLSNNLRAVLLNIAFAIMPTPIGLFFLLIAAKGLDVWRYGISTLSFKEVGTLLLIPIMITLMLLSIAWHLLIATFVLRILGRYWVKSARSP